MPHALKQNHVKQARGGREVMRTEPDFYSKPQQKHCQRRQRESNPTIAPHPRERQQWNRQNRAQEKAPEPHDLGRALLHEANKSAIVLVVLEFDSLVKILHDRITVFEFRQWTLPYKISSARVEAAVNLVAHAKRAAGHAVVVVAGRDGSGRQDQRNRHEYTTGHG